MRKSGGGRFKSKMDGIQRAKRVWICDACNTWHRIKPNNKTCHCGSQDVLYFPSEIEAKRYPELKLLQRSGVISRLKTQVRFKCVVEKKLVCTYIADFVYNDKNGRIVVEDVKPKIFRTNEFRIKKNLFEAIYPYQITEVES